jgi:hypothetical protein
MNYRIRKLDWKIAAGAVLGMLAGASVAHAQVLESPAERMLERSSGPDTFYFFEDDRKTVVDYKSEHVVRVCAGDSTHLVPLKVEYDNKQTTIDAGDCIRVEATAVTLMPDKTLDENLVIVAEVETLS